MIPPPSPTSLPATGVILAGGKSSRFGQDKALFLYQGKPLATYAIETLRPLCQQVLISTNHPEKFAFTMLTTIEDRVRDCGPLSGIHSGLHHALHSEILFLGCDMPLVPVELMNLLLKKLDDYDAVVPQHHGFRETLCMAMKKQALPVVQEALEEGRLRIMDVLQELNTCFTEVSHLPFFSPGIFANINYPGDINSLDSAAK